MISSPPPPPHPSYAIHPHLRFTGKSFLFAVHCRGYGKEGANDIAFPSPLPQVQLNSMRLLLFAHHSKFCYGPSTDETISFYSDLLGSGTHFGDLIGKANH